MCGTRDGRSGWPTNGVQVRTRSNSTPPNSFLHNQNLHVAQSWATGNVGDTVQPQGQDLIEVGGRSATHVIRGSGRRNSDAYPAALIPGRMPISSVHSPIIPGVTTNAPRVLRARKDSYRRRRILFYHKHEPYYGFTNFSAHPVMYEGRKYPTSEHLFQSLKVCKTRHRTFI